MNDLEDHSQLSFKRKLYSHFIFVENIRKSHRYSNFEKCDFDLFCSIPDSEVDMKNCGLLGISLDSEYSELRFRECTFIRCTFKETVFTNSCFSNCTFDNCKFVDATFDNCSFVNCKFEKVTSFENCAFKGDTQFEYCSLDSCRFYDKINFDKCDFHNSTITNCNFNKGYYLVAECVFVACIFKNINFRQFRYSFDPYTYFDCTFTDCIEIQYSHIAPVNVDIVIGPVGSGKIALCKKRKDNDDRTRIFSYLTSSKDPELSKAENFYLPIFYAIESGCPVAILNGGPAFSSSYSSSYFDMILCAPHAKVTLYVPDELYNFVVKHESNIGALNQSTRMNSFQSSFYAKDMIRNLRKKGTYASIELEQLERELWEKSDESCMHKIERGQLFIKKGEKFNLTTFPNIEVMKEAFRRTTSKNLDHQIIIIQFFRIRGLPIETF